MVAARDIDGQVPTNLGPMSQQQLACTHRRCAMAHVYAVHTTASTQQSPPITAHHAHITAIAMAHTRSTSRSMRTSVWRTITACGSIASTQPQPVRSMPNRLRRSTNTYPLHACMQQPGPAVRMGHNQHAAAPCRQRQPNQHACSLAAPSGAAACGKLPVLRQHLLQHCCDARGVERQREPCTVHSPAARGWGGLGGVGERGGEEKAARGGRLRWLGSRLDGSGPSRPCMQHARARLEAAGISQAPTHQHEHEARVGPKPCTPIQHTAITAYCRHHKRTETTK